MNSPVVAIVPAAGTGERFGSGTNKPFTYLGKKPLIIWALETLQELPEITEIIPVVKEPDLKFCRQLFEEHKLTKIRRVAPGGRERQDSVFHGLNLIKDRNAVVLVHDGVRPLIDPPIIRKAFEQLAGVDGVVIGVPLKDTVKEVQDGLVRNTPRRDLLWAVQTPQIFHFQPLYAAYEKAMLTSAYTTDDSALVERNGGKIRMVLGSYMNIKITTPEDLLIAEVFLTSVRGEE